jgi:PAS domain-containing protein
MLADITERKKVEQALVMSERQYRAVVENMPDFIVRYDTELRRSYVNPARMPLGARAATEEPRRLPGHAFYLFRRPTGLRQRRS